MLRRTILLMLACVLLVSAVGCKPAPAPPTPPKEPIVFRTAQARMPQSVDPHQHMGTSQYRVIFFVYESLVRFKRGTTELEPSLATAWAIAPDLKSVTFTLRQGVKFTDGAPFNAQAVKTSFDRLMAINLGPAAYLNAAESCEVLGDYQVRINLKRPSANFINFVPRFFIVSPALIEANKTADDPWAMKSMVRKAAGTAAYKMTAWVEGERLEFEKNEGYWGPFHEYAADKIIHLAIPDAATRVMKLERGEVDHIADMELMPALCIQLLKNKDLVTEVVETQNSVLLMLSTYKGPLQDIRVRKALAHAFDREAYARTVLMGIVGGDHPYLVPESMLYVNKDVAQYEYNIEKAKQLLAEAGYPNGGFELGFIGYGGWATEEGAGVVLQAGLAKLGITLKVWNPSWQVKQDTQNNPKTAWDMASLNVYPPLPHPGNLDSHLESTRGLGAGYNWSLYKNDRVDELFRLADATTDTNKLAEYYMEIQKVVMDDLPILPLATFNRVEAFAKNLDGWMYTPGLGHQTIYLPQDLGLLPTK